MATSHFSQTLPPVDFWRNFCDLSNLCRVWRKGQVFASKYLLEEVRHELKSLSVLFGWFQSAPVLSATQPNLNLLTTEIPYGPDQSCSY